ncbi:MAG: hypothetical protein ACFNUM_07510 [Segatella salivae]|jgi:hypothetical protein
MRKNVIIIILLTLVQWASAQNIGTKLGIVECVNNNTFSLMAAGNSANRVEYVYFTSPWLVDRQVMIKRADLSQAVNSVGFVRTKFAEWNNVIKGKGFKGQRKDFETKHKVYTREKAWKDWHPMPETLRYTFFVDLGGNISVEANMSLGNSSTFCFYLTRKGLDQFYNLLKNADSILANSEDAEFDSLLK